MPATQEQPVTDAAQSAAADASSVLDVSLFDKDQRAVQYLQYAGLIDPSDHQAVTTLNLLKRANHAAFALESNPAIAKAQADFRVAMQQTPDNLAALAEGGNQSPIFKLVDTYLTERSADYQRTVDQLIGLPGGMDEAAFNRARHTAEKKRDKYRAERDYYRADPELLNAALRAHPEALQGGYMPLGRLAIKSGIIQGDPAAVADMVDDTLANATAHSFLHLAKDVVSTPAADLDNYQRFPDQYKSNILAEATTVAASTTPLEKAHLVDEATPELLQLQTFKALISARLNAMTEHTVASDGSTNPPADKLAKSLAEISPLVRRAQSAVMSQAWHFLGEGAGKDDPRMQKLRAHLASMMEKNKIPLLMNRDEARQSIAELTRESKDYLQQKFAGNPGALAKLNTLLEQLSAPAPGMAEKYAPAPASYIERALQALPQRSVGLN